MDEDIQIEIDRIKKVAEEELKSPVKKKERNLIDLDFKQMLEMEVAELLMKKHLLNPIEMKLILEGLLGFIDNFEKNQMDLASQITSELLSNIHKKMTGDKASYAG